MTKSDKGRHVFGARPQREGPRTHVLGGEEDRKAAARMALAEFSSRTREPWMGKPSVLSRGLGDVGCHEGTRSRFSWLETGGPKGEEKMGSTEKKDLKGPPADSIDAGALLGERTASRKAGGSHQPWNPVALEILTSSKLA